MAERTLVSVVIPTKNNSDTIRNCLKSIRDQTHKDTEIILVDSFSTDDTVRIAEEMEAKVISLEGERTKAKNQGLLVCRGRYVCFIDSDMILGERVIEQCVESCKGNVAGIIIPERSIGKGFWVEVRDFERSLYSGSKIESARFFTEILHCRQGGLMKVLLPTRRARFPRKLRSLDTK